MIRRAGAGLRQRLEGFGALPQAVRRRFLVMAAPWIAGMLIGFPLLWGELDDAAAQPVLRAHESVLYESLDILRRTVGSVRQDAVLLGDLSSELPRSDVSAGSASAKLFMDFARSAGAYDRVRWLDEQGVERLRVDVRDGEPRLIEGAELRSRRGEPFFDRSVGLPRGSVYLSEVALDTERGDTARPPPPTLRVASPLHEGGTPRGVVVIDYRAGRLLDRLEGLGRRLGMAVYLVNDAGHWLRGPTQAESWAWQRDPGAAPLVRTRPALWRAMIESDSGRHVDRNGMWSFRRLELDRDGPASARSFPTFDELGLRVLVRTDPDAAAWPGWRWKLALCALMALFAALAARFAWQSVGSLIDEDRAARELREANDALRRANDNLRSMQVELARAERLSSLGLMVAGVAHELNTPLGSAGLGLSTLERANEALSARLRDGLKRSDLDRYVNTARDAVELSRAAIRRAGGIVQRFKQVAVDRTLVERRSFDLAEVLLDADPRLRAWDRSDPVTLHLSLQPGLRMNSYPGPLGQVIGNLVTNALTHAFAGRPHGCLAIETRADEPGWVVLQVSDDGGGIPPEHRQRVFDPFFTTNRHGGGTGLGLHICHQLVTEVLGGTIVLRADANDPAEGADAGAAGGAGGAAGDRFSTRFVIRLPCEAPRKDDPAP